MDQTRLRTIKLIADTETAQDTDKICGLCVLHDRHCSSGPLPASDNDKHSPFTILLCSMGGLYNSSTICPKLSNIKLPPNKETEDLTGTIFFGTQNNSSNFDTKIEILTL